MGSCYDCSHKLECDPVFEDDDTAHCGIECPARRGEVAANSRAYKIAQTASKRLAELNQLWKILEKAQNRLTRTANAARAATEAGDVISNALDNRSTLIEEEVCETCGGDGVDDCPQMMKTFPCEDCGGTGRKKSEAQRHKDTLTEIASLECDNYASLGNTCEEAGNLVVKWCRTCLARKALTSESPWTKSKGG